MRNIALSLLLGLPLIAFARAEESVSDTEIWNEGVGFYEAGEVTNALKVLRLLMLSKTYGARAAEVVAKLEFERGNQEEAASAAQIALRADAKNAKANRNFTRATDGLLEARRTNHINEVLARSKGKDAGTLLASATHDARRLLLGAGGYRTNDAPTVVRLADEYRTLAEELADCWIPVRETIVRSVTNEAESATILQQIAEAEARTKRAAMELGDLTDGSYGTVSSIEQDFTRFLKLTVLPPAALDFGFEAQSNAWKEVERVNGRDWQPDALDFTRSFRAKFPAWARAYEQEAQSNTNKPPFTVENQAKVSALATELEKLQLECCEQKESTKQERALGIIREIRELLPKDGESSGQPPQAEPQPPNKDDQRKQNEPQQDKSQQEKSSPNEENEVENKDAEKPPEDADLEAIMRKAQERNDEHEAEKRARMRKLPLPPNERDW